MAVGNANKGTEEPLLLAGSMRGLDPRLHAPITMGFGFGSASGVGVTGSESRGKVACVEEEEGNVKHHAGKGGGAPCAGAV